tara:strand:- start:1581 stop:1895 length:315 start_codon:yes stop_codon:yes gene_type:complete
MSLSQNTEGIYISKDRYDYILNRMKLKTTTHKTRYYFDIYQHPTTDKFYITHDVDLACTHNNLKLLSTEHFDIHYDKEKNKIYTVFLFANKSIKQVDLTVCLTV